MSDDPVSTQYYEAVSLSPVLALALLAVAIALPWVSSPTMLHVLIMVVLYAYLAQSWNIVGGYAGNCVCATQSSSACAYTSTTLIRFGICPWVGMLAAVWSRPRCIRTWIRYLQAVRSLLRHGHDGTGSVAHTFPQLEAGSGRSGSRSSDRTRIASQLSVSSTQGWLLLHHSGLARRPRIRDSLDRELSLWILPACHSWKRVGIGSHGDKHVGL